MLTGFYIKRTGAACFALYCQRTRGINAVNIDWGFVIAFLRYRRIAADDVVFRAVRQNNGGAVGQLDRGGCCGSHRNAF